LGVLQGEQGGEFFEGVAVAGGGGVEGDAGGLGDLVEGEVGPEFEDDDFALVVGKLLQGVLDEVAFFEVVVGVGGEEGDFGFC